MKRLFCLIAILSCACAFAQMTPEFYKGQFERQVKTLGYAGVGVENILDKWERVAPEDGEMLKARFHYHYEKGRSEKMEVKDRTRFLGQKPVLTLKDSLGRDVNYFREEFFDDAEFALASKAIDKAVSLYPDELEYRLLKISSLFTYEKDSPDMARLELDRIIDRNQAEHPAWTYKGEPVDEDTFVGIVQEYCYNFFTVGSPNSYEHFLAVSERMSKLYPKNPAFVSNIGTYWLVARQNSKKASKFYKKALKLNPDDYAAKKNLEIIQTLQSQKGRSSK